MMGRTHSLSGGVLFLAAVRWLPQATAPEIAAGTLIAAGAGVLPDLDHPNGTAAYSLGPISHWMCKLVAAITGGHRHATHSLIGIAAFTADGYASTTNRWSLLALLWICMGFAVRSLHHRKHPKDHLTGLVNAALCGGAAYLLAGHVSTHGSERILVTYAVAIGVTAHIAGDMLTEEGCPILYPHRRWYRIAEITTDHTAEHWVVTPLLLAALGYLIAIRTGVHLTQNHHIAWR